MKRFVAVIDQEAVKPVHLVQPFPPELFPHEGFKFRMVGIHCVIILIGIERRLFTVYPAVPLTDGGQFLHGAVSLVHPGADRILVPAIILQEQFFRLNDLAAAFAVDAADKADTFFFKVGDIDKLIVG